ncbi:MAG: hypothetical protein RR354_01175, partial [Mucinivorans sp.]
AFKLSRVKNFCSVAGATRKAKIIEPKKLEKSEARLVTELETARHRTRGGGETFRHTPLVQCYHRHSAIATLPAYGCPVRLRYWVKRNVAVV